MKIFVFIALLFNLLTFSRTFAQTLPANFPVLEELDRRKQLLDTLPIGSISFNLRPVLVDSNLSRNNSLKASEINLSPLINTSRITTDRPYGWGDYGMIPNSGFQTYFSGGIELKFKFLNLTFRPEFAFSQNRGYDGFPDTFSEEITKDKFYHWNRGDFPERFGDGAFTKFWWGQSKLTAQFGAFEVGASTQNIWWGPGQWNSLTFSNNAQGFAHLTINTIKPAKTFLGNFETQLIIGKLNSSGYAPSQFPELNNLYFKPLPKDWRYLNALMVSYNPKWVPNLFVGFARTFQVYNQTRGNTFSDWLPVFEAFQKEKFFDSGHSVDFDANGQDQQMVIFGRYLVPKAKAEIYFEYGRRDHAYNWREFILNPEHARAYIFGFNKLFDSPFINKLIQLRGEITQQQESINRIIRYEGLGGRNSWHMHAQARGFTNYGQALGVGAGQGANVQTLEIALVEDYNKMGLLFERLENNQGFYYRSFYEPSEHNPWIDLTIGFLFDKKWDNLLLSSKLQIINARNYQWQLAEDSTPDFPKGKNITSFLAQTSLIYFWNKD